MYTSTIVTLLIAMIAGASAFGVNPVSSSSSSSPSSTRLFGMPTEETMTAKLREQKALADRWASIRFLSDEEAEQQLSGQELANFKAYHQTIKDDFVKMKKIAEMMTQEFVQIKPKTKAQRKRDKWAKVQARQAANAAAVAALK